MIHSVITRPAGDESPLTPPRLLQAASGTLAEAIEAAVGEHRVSLIDALGVKEAQTIEIEVVVARTSQPRIGEPLKVSGGFDAPRPPRRRRNRSRKAA